MESASILSLQAVQKSHGSSNVESESQSSRGVDYDSGSTVQKSVKASSRHVLRDSGELRWLIHATENRQHVRVREYPQFRKLLVEIARYTSRALTEIQYLRDDIVVLPASTPSFTARSTREMSVQRQISHVYTLVPREGRVAASRLQA